MKPFQYAIIGGTGVYDIGVSSIQKTVETEYGEVE
ncbi:MAG TPA: S-methyl-5'-thioadenosine phosphorylase, partial [Deltaproteobacteria bacterium]|nr:S-methyl-5'-thioadenosine phosphorylase [Deltaproteobacteria bacterium]